MNQAKPNDADAFDDLLGQLVDELAMTRRAAPEPEPDQAVLLGIAKPAPTITPDAGAIPVDQAWGGNEIPEPRRKSMVPFLAIGGGLFAAVLIVGIYAVNTLSSDNQANSVSRGAPPTVSGSADNAAGVGAAQIPDPTATSTLTGTSTTTDTSTATGTDSTATSTATTTDAAAPEPAKTSRSKPKKKKRSSGGKSTSPSKKKDSFDDL